MQEFLLKKLLPKPLLKVATHYFDNTDLWLKIVLACSTKRASSLSSCLFFDQKSPLIIEREGIRYQMNPKDPIQRRIIMGFYENYSLQKVKELIPPRGSFLDIGANIGFYSLNIAQHLQGVGHIYAFEADPGVAYQLKSNVQLNPFCRNVDVISAAISNKDGHLSFYQSPGSCSGAGSLNCFADFDKKSTVVQVPTTTIDRFFEDKGITHIDCAKIDVEGSEPELLEGAYKTLQQKRLKHILIEFNGVRLAERGVSFSDFMQIFQHHGYQCLSTEITAPIWQNRIDPKTLCDNLLFKA